MEEKFSEYGIVGCLDDDADGTEDAGDGDTTAFITQCLKHGTNRVFLRAGNRYTLAELAESSIAGEWATLFAVRWACKRRGNPCPKALEEECAEADEMLKEIQKGTLNLPDAATAASGLPSWTNTRVSPNYPYGKVRVIGPESDPEAPGHAQRTDLGADYWTYR